MVLMGSKERKTPVLDLHRIELAERFKPTFMEHFTRRDKVAFSEGLSLIMEAKESEGLKKVELCEKAICRLKDALEIYGKKGYSALGELQAEASAQRDAAYKELAEALRGLEEGERNSYLEASDLFGRRKRVYGQRIPVIMKAPTDPSFTHGIDAEYYYHSAAFARPPTKEELRAYDRDLAIFRKHCNGFFEELAEICDSRAGSARS
jgi:hypothetical protein